MNTLKDQIQSKNLLRIKKIVDTDNNGDKFIIVRTEKNINFMKKYDLTRGRCKRYNKKTFSRRLFFWFRRG